MGDLLAIVVGVLYAASLYMIMRPSMVKLILGLAFLSHAANLLIFTSGRITRAHAPILSADASVQVMANPLPQALVLTAIVISFGVLAFAMALLYRSYKTMGSDNLNTMKNTEQ